MSSSRKKRSSKIRIKRKCQPEKSEVHITNCSESDDSDFFNLSSRQSPRRKSRAVLAKGRYTPLDIEVTRSPRKSHTPTFNRSRLEFIDSSDKEEKPSTSREPKCTKQSSTTVDKSDLKPRRTLPLNIEERKSEAEGGIPLTQTEGNLIQYNAQDQDNPLSVARNAVLFTDESDQEDKVKVERWSSDSEDNYSTYQQLLVTKDESTSRSTTKFGFTRELDSALQEAFLANLAWDIQADQLRSQHRCITITGTDVQYGIMLVFFKLSNENCVMLLNTRLKIISRLRPGTQLTFFEDHPPYKVKDVNVYTGISKIKLENS